MMEMCCAESIVLAPGERFRQSMAFGLLKCNDHLIVHGAFLTATFIHFCDGTKHEVKKPA